MTWGIDLMHKSLLGWTLIADEISQWLQESFPVILSSLPHRQVVTVGVCLHQGFDGFGLMIRLPPFLCALGDGVRSTPVASSTNQRCHHRSLHLHQWRLELPSALAASAVTHHLYLFYPHCWFTISVFKHQHLMAMEFKTRTALEHKTADGQFTCTGYALVISTTRAPSAPPARVRMFWLSLIGCFADCGCHGHISLTWSF